MMRRHLGATQSLLPIGTEEAWQPLWLSPAGDSLPPWVEVSFKQGSLDPPSNVSVGGVPVSELLTDGYWELFGPMVGNNAYRIEGEWHPMSSTYTSGEPIAALLREAGTWTSPPQDSFMLTELSGNGLKWEGAEASAWGQWALARLAYPLNITPAQIDIPWRAWISQEGPQGRELSLEMPASGPVAISLYDLQGRRWHQQTWFAQTGIGQRWIPLPDEAPQLWLLEIQVAGTRQVIKILP